MPLVIHSKPERKKVAKKQKILVLSDDPRAPSGVGIQCRLLIEGLLATGKYSFVCLAGAIKHNNYNSVTLNQDFIIKPVDGFGDHELIKNILLTERPDAVFIFTDPRQFMWLWEIEDEVRQVAPIVYWHVWDNDPYPEFNDVWYQSTDLINCLSHKTYELVHPKFPDKTHYIPHAFPKTMFYPAPSEEEIQKLKKDNLGDKADWFIGLWINRNAARKMPSDLLESWKLFLDKLQAEQGHKKALLIMHTNPEDPEGPNLAAVQHMLGLHNNVLYSTAHVPPSHMNVLHNISDVFINISKNEGFGLGSLEQLQCGKPIVVLKTGGLTRQVIDHRTNTELGVGIEPVTRKLIGGQLVPYIYEDYAAQEDVANAIMRIYKMTKEEKESLKEKALDYVNFEFNYEKMIADWDRTLSDTITKFKTNPERKWSLVDLSVNVEESVTKPVQAGPKNPRDMFKKIEPSVLAKIGRK